MKKIVIALFILIFVILSVAFLYEFVYISRYPAIHHLLKAVTKIHDSDKTFKVYCYHHVIEFSNETNPENLVPAVFGDDSNSLGTNYVLLSKEGLFVNKKTSYFVTNITNLCIIISDDLNLRELNKGYQFIKRNFKYQKLAVTQKIYLDENYDLHMKDPLKISFKNYDDNEFQATIKKLQNSK